MIERRGFEMAYFYSFIRGLAVFFILLQVIIGILPGEKYGKYMRMIIGIFILSYITYFLRNWDIQKDLTNFDKITNIYEEKLMEVEKDYEEYEAMQQKQVLSALENKVEEELENLAKEEGYCVNYINIELCLDKEDKNYGKIDKMKIFLAPDIEKYINISIDEIVLDEEEKSSISQVEEKIMNYITRQYKISEGGVKIWTQGSGKTFGNGSG